jgi:hypothetical protein
VLQRPLADDALRIVMRGADGRSGGSMIVRLALKKRTKHGQRSMYAMGHVQTHAMQQTASPHSMTLSARANKPSGTVTPIALAVFRLITSSNLVGCSTGMSASLVPRKS